MEAKDYPLPFSREMVTATLAGRKTETRRLMLPHWKPRTSEGRPHWNCPKAKPYPGATVWDNGYWHTWDAKGVGAENGVDASVEIAQAEAWDALMRQTLLPHPYAPGDRLWVKESYWQAGMFHHPPIEKKWSWWGPHGAEDVRRVIRYYGEDRPELDRPNAGWRQKSGRFMPGWASRIFLQVDAVRYERLHEITDAGILAEGITFDGEWWRSVVHPAKGTLKCWPAARTAFEKLWDSLNADRAPWASNPWVRVTQYHVLEVRSHGG